MHTSASAKPVPGRLRGASLVAIAALLITAASAGLIPRMPVSMDMLAVMPSQSAAVQGFRALDARFGALGTGQVTIEAPDALAPDFLRTLQTLTTTLQAIPGVKQVLSLTNVPSIAPDLENGGVITDRLVNRIPTTPKETAQLRARVMAQPQVVGSLVAADGRAVQLICSLDPRPSVAAAVRQAVLQAVDGSRVGLGGAPFIGQSIGASVAHAVQTWAPWAAMAWIIASVWALRDGRALFWLLASTLGAVTCSLGALAATGASMESRLALLPLVWVLLGSGLSLHVLMSLRQGGMATWMQAMRITAPTWLAGGLACLVFIGPILWGDSAQKQAAALTMLGCVICTIWSAGLLPALHSLLPARHRPRELSAWGAPRLATVVLLMLLAGAATQLPRLRGGSSADMIGHDALLARGQSLQEQHFATRDMLIVGVDTDLTHPRLLARLQELADEIVLLDGVTGVLHVGDALRLANLAMEGLPRLPDDSSKVLLLYSFLQSDASARRLVSGDGQHAALYVQLAPGHDEQAVVQRVNDIVAASRGLYHDAPASDPHAAHNTAQRLATRIRAAAQASGIALGIAKDKLGQHIIGTLPPANLDSGDVTAGIEAFLASSECPAPIPRTDPRNRAIALQVAQLGPNPSDDAIDAAVGSALGPKADPDMQMDLTVALPGPLTGLWQVAQADAWARSFLQSQPDAINSHDFRSAVGFALQERLQPTALLPGSGPGQQMFDAGVYGQPILDEVLARATVGTWWRAFVSGSLILLVGLAVFTRSWRCAWVLSLAPIGTALLIFGVLSARRLPLDPTSDTLLLWMLAMGGIHAIHIALGSHNGRAMVYHSLILCACFGVLAAFTGAPLQRVAEIVALASAVGVFVTWILVSVPLAGTNMQATQPRAVGEQS